MCEGFSNPGSWLFVPLPGWRREFQVRREGNLGIQGAVLDQVDSLAELLHGGDLVAYLKVDNAN